MTEYQTTAPMQEATRGADADAPPVEHLQHFTLPSLTRQLLRQEQRLQKEEQRREQLARLNSDAFGQWDDYCLNVLGVASDSLPLFPEMNYRVEKEDIDDAMDEYALRVKNVVLVPMKHELEGLSERFLESLSIAENGSTGGIACHGEDIFNAISYHRQFAKFLSSSSTSSSIGDDGNNSSSAAQSQQGDSLSTLYQYVTTPTSSATATEESEGGSPSTMISQFTFITSPITRSNLVSDLQQLISFLTSRKQELSSRAPLSLSTRNIKGRDVIDAIELEWAQYCMTQHARELCGSSSSSFSLAQLSLEDVARFHSAAQHVLSKILGDGTQAKKLRFLADAVGVSLPENSAVFCATCRKAASLARRMTLYQDQQEVSAEIVKSCGVAIELTKREIEDTTRRIELILEGV